MGFCEQCNKWVPQTEGKKKKRFCNETCRSNFWYAKNKKKPVVPSEPNSEQYNGPKKPANFKGDEPVFKPAPVVPKVAADAIMRKYVEDRRDCGSQEEYVSWVEKLETDERLSTRQKELVKNTR